MFRGITPQESWLLITTCSVSLLCIVWFSLQDKQSRVTSYNSRSSPSVPVVIEQKTPDQSSTLSESITEPEEEPEAILEGQLDINIANIEDFQLLPGIGPVKAHAIVDHREAYGGFQSLEGLTEVPGIGEKTLEKLRPMITMSDVPFPSNSPVTPGNINSPAIQQSTNPAPSRFQNSTGFQSTQQSTQPRSTAFTPDGKIRVNVATYEELQMIKGIGPVLAEKIVIDRARSGPYKNLNDFQRVKGIGPSTAESFAPMIRFD